MTCGMVWPMPEMFPARPGRRADRQEPSSPEPGARLWPTDHWPLAELRVFIGDVLVAMAENRDVMRDSKGKPKAKLRASGEDSRCSYCHLVVDLSAIGLPVDSPLAVVSHDGDTFVCWHLGRVPLAQTPKGLSAKEAAEAINMDVLLAAHRRLVRAGK